MHVNQMDEPSCVCVGGGGGGGIKARDQNDKILIITVQLTDSVV